MIGANINNIYTLSKLNCTFLNPEARKFYSENFRDIKVQCLRIQTLGFKFQMRKTYRF